MPGNLHGQTTASAAAADSYGVDAAGNHPAVLPQSEAAVLQLKAYHLGLTRLQEDLDEALQLLHRAVETARGRGHVELHDLRAGPITGVGDRDCDHIADDLRLCISECCVGQSVAERPADVFFRLVIVAVAHIDAFLIQGVFGTVEFCRGAVPQDHGPGLRQLAAGIGTTVEQVSRGFAAGLTGQTQVENGFDLLRPGAFHDAAAQQHHHRVGIGGGNGVDQLQMALRHMQMFPVIAFGLILIRQARKDHCHIGGFGGGDRLCQQFFRGGAIVETAHDVGQVRHGRAGGYQFGGIDVAGAGALEPGSFCHGADEDHGLLLR